MTTLAFPQQFQGFFHRTKNLYLPPLLQARATLNDIHIPETFEPFYAYAVKENPQPSFMLLPLMYLGIADAYTGINERHHQYLPYIMLMMELCAIMDDTVDRTPMRSSRPTFTQQFGEESATPFSVTLLSLATHATSQHEPQLLPSLHMLVSELGSRELWEMHNRYPHHSLFNQWLDNRYAQVSPAIEYVLNGALSMANGPQLSPAVVDAFARIFQDVDDVINIIEARENDGENRDLDLGIVTYPLIAACEAVPGLDRTITQFWQPYHAIAKLPRAQFLAELPSVIAAQQQASDHIYECFHEYGIPATIRHIEEDCAICIENTPEGPLRTIIEEFVLTFAARIPQLHARTA